MDASRTQRHLAGGWAAAGGFGVAAAALAALASRGPDDRWATWALLAEPLAWVISAWCGYVGIAMLRDTPHPSRVWRRRVAPGLLGVASGLALGVGWAHRPVQPSAPGAPPTWADHVQRCARALAPPLDPVRLLQWTLSGDEDVALLVGRVVAAAPDVAILNGPVGPALGRALTEELGGEFVHRPASGRDDGRLVLTRGTFHRCGDASHWSDTVDDPYGATLLFVGTSSETAWPLVVGRLPAPWVPEHDWARVARSARDRAAALAEVLDAPSLVVAMDSPRGSASRALDAAMLGARLLPTPAAPNWPVRLGVLPMIPLHPWDRAWVGPAWRFVRSQRTPARLGDRDPLLTELHPQPVP